MRTREAELFFKSLFLNLTILNVIFILNVWISPNLSLSDYLVINKYLLFFNLSWIITQFVFFRKTFYLGRHFIHRVIRISSQMLIFIFVSALSLFFITPETIKPSFFLGYWMGFYGVELLVYLFLFSYQRNKYEKGSKLNRVIIVGFNNTGQFFQKLLESNPMLGYKFVGFVNTEFSTNPSVLGQPDGLATLIEKYRIQTIFVVQSLFKEDKMQRYLEICDSLGVRLWMISDNYEVNKRTIKKKSINGLMLINPREIPLDYFGARFLKRTFDIVFSSLVILLVLSWLFPILAILIKLSSKGPVFFIQKRTGLNNSIFNCYKLRTMCINDKADILQATSNDERVTRIGNFLRKTNIDEFPQFINVFLGQMSVVGPRPHMLKHTEEYSALINGYLIRHFVKPGITGWAQVNGLHGETDKLWKMEKRVEYDIHYMNNWTLWLDIKIIPMTIFRNRKFLRIVHMERYFFEKESAFNETDELFNSQQNERVLKKNRLYTCFINFH